MQAFAHDTDWEVQELYLCARETRFVPGLECKKEMDLHTNATEMQICVVHFTDFPE
jgi:hypothetical protein